MRESVELDLLGEVHLDFDDHSVNHVVTSIVRWPKSRRLLERQIAINEPLSYQNIEWIGEVRQRQRCMLTLGLSFTLLGILWTVVSYGDWGAFGVSVAFLVLLGLWPLSLYFRGRSYLGIASGSRIIVVPMDRKKGKVRRILGLLAQHCPESRVQWELDRSSLADRQKWDDRPTE